MSSLFNIVLPIFTIIAAGYFATRFALISVPAVDSIMKFAQNFAIPCLLFQAIANLDLSSAFEIKLIFSFFFGATICFFLGTIAAKFLFSHPSIDSIAIGFSALFSNLIFIGLPIMELAYGQDSTAQNYTIIAFHAPFCYLLGITSIEIVRAGGKGIIGSAKAVVEASFKNPLVLAILLGFMVNLCGLTLPDAIATSVHMIAQTAIPVALFGMGGVLVRYGFSPSLGEPVCIATLSLFVHPAIVYLLTFHVFSLEIEFVRAGVICAAMAPGIHSYLFSNMYNRATGMAASTILLATIASIFSVSIWLSILES